MNKARLIYFCSSNVFYLGIEKALLRKVYVHYFVSVIASSVSHSSQDAMSGILCVESH